MLIAYEEKDGKYPVTKLFTQANKPISTITENYFITEKELPIPELNGNMHPILYCDPATENIWYEYEEYVPTPDPIAEKIATLEGAIMELTAIIAMNKGEVE